MEEKKFTIVFKKSPDFKIYPAQVIYGGPTPDLSGVVMNFGVDHHPIPSYVQHPIEGTQVLLGKIDQIAQVGNVERELLGALYITTSQAKSTAQWLLEQVEKIEGSSHE
jgi:hypothetical protein